MMTIVVHQTHATNAIYECRLLFHCTSYTGIVEASCCVIGYKTVRTRSEFSSFCSVRRDAKPRSSVNVRFLHDKTPKEYCYCFPLCKPSLEYRCLTSIPLSISSSLGTNINVFVLIPLSRTGCASRQTTHDEISQSGEDIA